MIRPARGMRFMVLALTTLLVAVSCVKRDEVTFGTLNKELGRSMDEEKVILYMHSIFVPGMDYHEVHQTIAEIGEYQVCEEIVQSDGMKVEIVEMRTGAPALDEYDYLIWDFGFTPEGELIRVGLNSWWQKCIRTGTSPVVP